MKTMMLAASFAVLLTVGVAGADPYDTYNWQQQQIYNSELQQYNDAQRLNQLREQQGERPFPVRPPDPPTYLPPAPYRAAPRE